MPARECDCRVNDFEKRKQLGIAARKTITERFTLKRYIDVFEQQYQKLID